MAVLLIATAAVAEDEHQTEVQIGPFHATGDWTVTGTTIKGEGNINLRGDTGIAVRATYDTERQTGRWQGTFSVPILGQTKASGQITARAFLFRQKVNVGAGTASLDFVLTPDHLTGEGQGSLKVGKVGFGRVGLRYEDGDVTATSAARTRLPGVSTPIDTTLHFHEGLFDSATGSAKILLGSHVFQAQVVIKQHGEIEVTATASQTLPGIGATSMTLVYEDGRLSAVGTRTVTLGNLAFDNTTLTIDKSGKIGLSKTSSADIPGIGATQLTLTYANNRLSASGKRQIKLGTFAFDDTAITVDSAGTVSLAKQAAINLPGLGSTQMALSYANGVLSASGSRDVSLGSIAFSSVAVTLSSNGTVTLIRSQSVSIPGLGSTQMALSYANGVLSASGSRDVSLGSFLFSDTAIAISSNGTVSLSKSQALNLPGLGSSQMALTYANGVLSATGSRDLSLGSFLFSNTAIAISSNGTVTLSKSQSLNIPGLGSTQMALNYANGVLSASGSRDVSLGSFLFSNTAIAISSNGTVTLSKAQAVNIPGLGSTQMALSYANGVLSASGSRDVNLGSFLFSNTAIAISSNGTVTLSKAQAVNIPGLGSTQMALSYANGVLSATGSRDVSLGSFLFSNTAIAISSNGTVTLSKSQSLNIPGLGSTQMALSYANGALSASGSRDVSLGNFAFSNAAISLSSTGTVSVIKSQSITIPGIGATQLSLGYANGQVSANGSASITVSVLGHSLNFGSAAVHVSSSGSVSVSASQGINIGPLHYNVSITYENGSIVVHY